MGVLIAYSSSAHRNLDLLSTREVPDRTGFRTACLTVLPAQQGAVQPPSVCQLLSARRTGATPLCRADPGRAAPAGTPGDGPPGRNRPGRGVHTHPGRAAYREDRGRNCPRSPRRAAVRSWPLAPDTPHRYVQGIRGHASGQTRLSLPPRTDLTPSGQESNSAAHKTVVIPAMLGRDAFLPRSHCQSCFPVGCSVSGRMSIRQPVSRAARRAFCPSLPIASDSW